MNDKKDIEKTSTWKRTAPGVLSENEHQNKPAYEFANKKTEKLVTALYMITDCMETADAIKGKLRLLGVELLSDMHKLSILSPVEKHASVTVSLSRIGEIMALVEIAYTIGFVSEMNGSILKKEFTTLVTELRSYQAENESSAFGGVLFESQKNSSFTLSESMFDVGENLPTIKQSKENTQPATPAIKDTTTHKRTPYMSFTNNRLTTPATTLKRLPIPSGDAMSKNERVSKILAIIKDNASGGAGVSIKDISRDFATCSEKTIQRELNSLISLGQIKKIGAKRWSRYSLA